MAPQHQRNDSYPVSPSQYEDSPTFVYSAARPPTTYSHYSWTPPSAATPGRHARRSSLPPPLPALAEAPSRRIAGPSKISPESDYSAAPRRPVHPALVSSSSFSSEYEPRNRTGALPAETPLYARQSWDDPYNASGSDSDSIRSPARPWMQQNMAGRRMTGSSHGRSAYVPDRGRPDSWADEPTAWSKSSYGTRPRTAAPTKSALGTVFEEQDYEEKGYYDAISLAPQSAVQTAPSAYTPVTPGRGGVPPVPDINEWYNAKSARMSRHSRRSSAPMGRAVYDSPDVYTARHSIGGQGNVGAGHPVRDRTASRHTVGSVFDMNALSAHPYPPDFTPGPNEKRGQPPVAPLPTGQLPMLSPSKQHQLGRMSVAPARYTLPPSARQPGSAPDRTHHTDFQPNGFPPHTAVQNPYVADPFADPPQDPAFDVDEKAAERFYQQQNQQFRELDSGANPYRDPALGWEPAQEADLAPEDQKNAFGRTLDKVRNATFGIYYRTYRPFVRPLLTISAAMCLNLTMQGPAGGTEWGTMVKLAQRGMGVMPPETDGKEVGLGLLGWCALGGDTPVCLPYRSGDFISTSKKYRIHADGSSLLSVSTDLLTALMALLYFMAAFHLVVAFLHFFLLFGISVPFDHLYTSDPLPPLTGFTAASKPLVRKGGVTSRQILQKEVDMRVRCERTPYEAYYWVWWAWWAHRRSGLGDLFAFIVGLLGFCTLIMATQFYNQVSEAANPGKASFGAGSFVTLLAFLLTLDPFICSVRFVLQAQTAFLTFLHPPEPSVGAIVLPPRAERMRHRKNPSGTPFKLGNGNAQHYNLDIGRDPLHHPASQFEDLGTRPGTVNFPRPPPSRASRASRGVSAYNRQTMRNDQGQSVFFDPDAPDLPGVPPMSGVIPPQTDAPNMADMDEETIRWLAAYPADPDLVPLVERVKDANQKIAAGLEVPEDDFILSDVGLLYLRPDASGVGAEQDALLVPPRGAIRDEILEDTHFAIIDEENDMAAHWEAEEMVRQMSETFWWPSMGTDAQAFVASCAGCTGGESVKMFQG